MRAILTAEAVLVQTGTDDLGMDLWEVQLMVNHHVVYRWEMGVQDAWALRSNGSLESFVAAKIFRMLHPVTVRDITPVSYTTGTGQTLINVHRLGACGGRPCVVHNLTDGPWRDWPTHWREDRRIMERICPCGVGHPAAEEYERLRMFELVHGCCGCPCSPEER